MAANRTLKTNFWSDRYVASLPTEYRYLYLYLKLNKHIQTSGCCQLKVLQMAVETGLSVDVIRDGLQKLQQDGKIRYEDDWLAVAGEMQNKGVKLQAATDLQLAQAPEWVGEFLVGEGGKDSRAYHPAIQLIRDLTERYPPRSQWDVIIELLGDDLDEEYFRECHAEWARRAYNPRGTAWYTDWYVNRTKPGSKKEYVKQTNADTLREYYEVFSAKDQ